ncbi:MAG: serine/threonine-protein kinase, partial [Gemmatimonadaceae bacterium]
MSDAAARRWRETCELFHQLSDLDTTARSALLLKIGESDPEMRSSIETLLVADSRVDEDLMPLALGISEVLHRNLMGSRAPALDSLRLTGRMLSHFRIIEPIAAGGMGVVYRAHDTRLNREVALKLPLIAEQLDSRGRSRFMREALAAGALDHPNLCSIYEVGESDEGRPFMAMALYAGEPLRSRMAREGRLPVDDVLDIARQVAAGLAFAHDAGVIHRD